MQTALLLRVSITVGALTRGHLGEAISHTQVLLGSDKML